MKKLNKITTKFLLVTAVIITFSFWNNNSFAQCNSSTQNASVASNNTGSTQTWSQNANSHQTLTGVTNGSVYKVSSSSSDFLTVKTGSAGSGGTVITSGTSPVTFTATATTIYVVVRTNSSCNTSNGSRTISWSAKPTITSISASACAGSTATITGTAFSGVSSISVNGTNAPTFSIVSSSSITVTIPASATTGTISVTGPGGTATSGSSITVNAKPADNAGIDKSFCTGSNTTIGAASTAGRTYSWSPSTGLSSSTVSNPTVSPASTTTYNLTETITATGCSATNSTVVTVNPLPSNNSGGNKTICNGSSTSIGASSTSGRTYSWSPSTGLTNSTSANPTASSTTTTTYTLTETITATGCSSSNSMVVTVNAAPVLKTPYGATSICSGNSVNISIDNSEVGVNYQLRNNSGNTNVGAPVAGTGGTINFPTGTLSSSTTYNVLATKTSTSCSLQMTGTITITANALPGNNSGGNKTVCGTGNSVSLGSASTAGRTYSWSPATFLNNAAISNPTCTPTTTTTYTLTETITATGCSATNSIVVTLSSVPSVSITPNYCNGGGNVQLTASAGTSYLWSTGSTTNAMNVDMAGTYGVTVTNVSGCTGSSSYLVALELVVNGDFSAGNIGFTTSYTYTADVTGNSELVTEGLYSVGTNANNYHSLFFGKDHTTGTGNFMIVNGSTSATPVTVWQENITVIPNTIYYFSAYARSVNNVGPFAQLKFAMDGVVIGTTAVLPAGVNTTAGPFTWTRFYAYWNSGSSTSATVSIEDLQTAAGGNDFALDDISCSTLSTVPLTVTPTTNSPVCAGNALTINANVLGGEYPMTYSWSGPNSFISSSVSNTVSSPTALNSGVYSVTVTDAHSCVVTGSTSSATINSLPTDITPSGTVTINPGTSTSVVVAGSQIGVDYQLRNNIGNVNVGTPVAGTGGTINLPTGNLIITTTFNVLASNATTTCIKPLTTTITVTVGSTLPIKLLSFTAEKFNADKDVLLKWSTASEENNDHFEVEAATENGSDGKLKFIKIGEVVGAGTSYSQLDYSLIDTSSIKSGIWYYRLKQVDFDKTTTYSEIEVLQFNSTNIQLTQLYPNPVSDRLFFNVASPDDRQVEISINNIAGQKVFLETLDLTPGNNSFTFDLSELTSGLYLFNLQGGTDIQLQQKFNKN